jgi:23S rRNA U2552 (ribose-2'-O)-methylase RlmE/FtsJ
LPDVLKYPGLAWRLLSSFGDAPSTSLRTLNTLPSVLRGARRARVWSDGAAGAGPVPPADGDVNPLQRYFEANTTGPGIWKWDHYFDIYHQYLHKFVGQDVHVVEVGIFSGGSLPMWQSYFGPRARIYGVDIEPACTAYAGDGVEVFIGDQGDRRFWQTFREQVPRVDVLIDDGGHLPEQQIVTLEEMLPHLSRGGIYICEDIHGLHQQFFAYVSGLAAALHAYARKPGGEIVVDASPVQRSIHAIHTYPFLTVFEKARQPRQHLVSPKHGTEWQPFLE